ncbi:addiction module antidote protein [Xanthomonas arboricola]|uniref:addiction module antidote protein n=1 Tax=Xanthomonas arboricola TaxID=56448 RepID=UPI000C85E06D|nr:addiction module antidote protein [Xanthomonas arboricola]PPU28696.1 putative addiction module antidote protein [Xanthomonas arboricola]SOT99580.1 putative addiction module antidote protein [Xanthomonas arboricola pv. fragariae]
MTKTTTTPFDPAEYLDDDEAMATYLSEALASGDTAHFQDALQVVARARGMTQIAEAAGLGRESLYKALKPGANPRFDTIQRVLAALGVRLNIAPADTVNAT